MKRVIAINYSQFYDPLTETEFEKVMDQSTGCFLGIASVSDKVAKDYDKRVGFRVLTDDEYAAITTPPALPEVTDPETGDPLSDAAKLEGANAGPDAGNSPPPPPPAS